MEWKDPPPIERKQRNAVMDYRAIAIELARQPLRWALVIGYEGQLAKGHATNRCIALRRVGNMLGIPLEATYRHEGDNYNVYARVLE